MENSTLGALINTSGDSDDFSDWRLSQDINPIALGLFWALLNIYILVVNAFICIYSVVYIYKKKTSYISQTYTTQSSLLLFNLSLTYLVQGLFALPFTVIATFSGEWLVYQPKSSKEATCTFSGFILNWTYTIALHTIAVISIERFLFVTNPHKHRTKFTTKVIIGLILFTWLYPALLAATPYLFGGYTFFSKGGICITPMAGIGLYWLAVFVVYATIPIVVVMVMIVATCVFARRFAVKLRRKVGNGHTAVYRTPSGPTSSQNSGNGNLHQPTDSNQKMCCSDCCCMPGKKCFALFGVFGSLVVIYSIQLLTGSVSTIVTLFKGPAFQPDVLQGAFTYLTISLPAISGAVQVYFRPEFRRALMFCIKGKMFKKRTQQPWDSTPHSRSQQSTNQLPRQLHDPPSIQNGDSRNEIESQTTVLSSNSDLRAPNVYLDSLAVTQQPTSIQKSLSQELSQTIQQKSPLMLKRAKTFQVKSGKQGEDLLNIKNKNSPVMTKSISSYSNSKDLQSQLSVAAIRDCVD